MSVFTPRDDESPVESMKRRLGETMGFVSTCWKPDTGNAVFDSEQAGAALEELEQAVVPLVKHSIALNEIAWKMAVALGEVKEGDGMTIADPHDLLDRLIAKADGRWSKS